MAHNTLGKEKSKYFTVSILLVVKSFMKNLLMTKSSDYKSDLVKGHAPRRYKSTGKHLLLRKKSYRERLIELKLPTLKYRRIRGDMIEVYKLLMNKYDDNTVHLDINIDTRTRGHIKKLVVNKCHYDVRKYSFCIRVVNI